MESLRALRQIVTLAEIGRYRKASEKLGITHSALSQAVKRIEEFYGVDIFHRQDGRIVPTEYGRLLVEAARESLTDFDSIAREIHLIKNYETGSLTVGAEPHVSHGLVAPAMGRLMARHPKLKITLRSTLWSEMQDQLHNRTIDIYVGLSPDEKLSDIRTEELIMPPPVIACRAGHPLTQRDDWGAPDVLTFPLASGDAPDWYFRQIQSTFPANIPSVWQLRDLFLLTYDLSVLPVIVTTSDAIAFLPYPIIRPALKAGLAANLNVPGRPLDKPVPGIIATLDSRALSPAGQALRREIHAELAGAPGPSAPE